MPTLEELRKKRIQELQDRNKSSSVSDARTKRLEEIKKSSRTFIEPSKDIPNVIDEDGSTALEAFGRSAAVNVLPITGGLALGSKAAVAGFAVGGPVGAAAGFIGGGIVGAVLTKKAQDEVLKVTKGEKWKRNLDQSIAEDRKSHPYATLIGESAPQLIAFRPSPSTLKQAFKISKRILTDPKSLAKHTKTLQGKTELDALMNVGIGAGIDVSLETYQQAREGDVNALRIIGSAIIGGVISDPNRLGVKIGFKPTGDAVIEEYNKFGSQTPAAKIITQGDIPVIDRSTDSVLLEREELRSILTGKAEENRFDNPRILEAERIAGTIDKNVTADSIINVYRLDGRSGNLRIGERVTANPHIADVFGGRINPETTMRAGDLVRTSKGDYIYAPKESIEARPKLPPIGLNVDKKVRGEVVNREKIDVKSAKSRAREATRLQEEPARLKKEADELAVKQEKEKVKLEATIKKTQVEEKSNIVKEKARVKSEKAEVQKRLDKESEAVTTRQRKEMADAKIAHVKRLEKANTKLQKAKEAIRFSNTNAKIRAKAIKAKKKLTEESKESVSKIIDSSKDIQKKARVSVIKTRKEINELDIPPEKKIKAKIKKKSESKSEGKTETKEKASKTTLIGTKRVQSQSIVKNAVKEAQENSKLAQANDDSITDQAGTTFVEQRKLSVELMTSKGFDDTLRFASEASDSELSKLGINRSALYEILYKTAIKEGQFAKFHDDLERLALLVADEVSEAAQKSSLHRLATQNDPFRRVAALKKALLDKEKSARGSVFKKEVDELHAKIKAAGTEADITKIIKDNLC